LPRFSRIQFQRHSNGPTSKRSWSRKAAFQDSIDDYLEYCQSRGEAPDKPFSGRFLLRVDPSLHRRLAELSGNEGISLNHWIASRLAQLTQTT